MVSRTEFAVFVFLSAIVALCFADYAYDVCADPKDPTPRHRKVTVKNDPSTVIEIRFKCSVAGGYWLDECTPVKLGTGSFKWTFYVSLFKLKVALFSGPEWNGKTYKIWCNPSGPARIEEQYGANACLSPDPVTFAVEKEPDTTFVVTFECSDPPPPESNSIALAAITKCKLADPETSIDAGSSDTIVGSSGKKYRFICNANEKPRIVISFAANLCSADGDTKTSDVAVAGQPGSTMTVQYKCSDDNNEFAWCSIAEGFPEGTASNFFKFFDGPSDKKKYRIACYTVGEAEIREATYAEGICNQPVQPPTAAIAVKGAIKPNLVTFECNADKDKIASCKPKGRKLGAVPVGTPASFGGLAGKEFYIACKANQQPCISIFKKKSDCGGK